MPTKKEILSAIKKWPSKRVYAKEGKTEIVQHTPHIMMYFRRKKEMHRLIDEGGNWKIRPEEMTITDKTIKL